MLVYIAEAHAADEWPINSTRCNGPGNTIRAPRTLDERRAIAHRMVEALELPSSLPVLVDGMDDAFLHCYAAWPIRLFGVRCDGSLGVVPAPHGGAFDMLPMREWLLSEVAASAPAPAQSAYDSADVTN